MDLPSNCEEGSGDSDSDAQFERGDGGTTSRMDGFDYLEILHREVWLLLAIFLVFIFGAYMYARLAPTRYEAIVVLSPTKQDVQTSGTAAVALATLGLGGAFDKSNQKSVALALLESRALIQKFIADNNLLPVLFADRWDGVTRTWKSGAAAPTLEDGYKALFGTMRIEEDKIRNVIKLHLRWTNSQTAANWANGLVKMVNTDMQTRTIADAGNMISYLNGEYDHTTIQELRANIAQLIEEQIKTRMLANSQNEFALTVIDPAEPTKGAVEPRVPIILAAGGMLGLLFGVPAAFLRYSWARRRIGASRSVNRLRVR